MGGTYSNGSDISIHALLAESDDARHGRAGAAGNFYPRSPCGERLAARGKIPELDSLYFYPRSPCGERRLKKVLEVDNLLFLSTLSLRRATLALRSLGGSEIIISIHALLAESDC